MQRQGHIVMVLRSGDARPHVSSHVDCLTGACRHASHFGIRAVDRALNRWGGGFRTCCVFHARKSLGRIGQQHAGFSELEERLGLSRTYRVELAESDRTTSVVAALRETPVVESVGVQTLSVAPVTALRAAMETRLQRPPRRLAWAPHRMVHAPEALTIEPGDERVTVAVVDTGVSLGHQELQRKLLAGFDCVDLGMGRISPKLRLVGDSRGRDFTPRDLTGHGSHVAGIIGAQGWRIPPGLAGRSLLLPIRVLAAARPIEAEKCKLVGIGCEPDIDLGIKVAVDLGADVINCSFGTPASLVDPHAPRPHHAVTRYAANFGCVLVAAAGNSGALEEFYPAALPQVIAVGSVNEHGQRSSFSTYGEHLAVCAPGERVVSIGRRGYMVSSGTSHAAPLVSATAALLISLGRRAGRELEGSDVRRVLVESAAPLDGGGFKAETGHGLLDAEHALRHLQEALARGHPPGKPRTDTS